MDSELKKIIEKKGLVISRLPEWTKIIILENAKVEHSNDYGEAVAHFVRDAMEYRALKSKFINGDLNILMSQNQPEKPNDEKSIRFANGNKINKMEVKNNE